MSEASRYQPPYTVTPAIVNLVAEISEAIGCLTILTNTAKALRLRCINRIRTIRGSLAIEGNPERGADNRNLGRQAGYRATSRDSGGA